MSPFFIVIVQVLGQQPVQVLLVQNDAVIEAAASNCADYALNERILPGGSRSGYNLFNAEVADSLFELFTVDTISVPQKKPWSAVIREGVDALMSRPNGRRRAGDVEM